jgi:hypothetical protein
VAPAHDVVPASTSVAAPALGTKLARPDLWPATLRKSGANKFVSGAVAKVGREQQSSLARRSSPEKQNCICGATMSFVGENKFVSSKKMLFSGKQNYPGGFGVLSGGSILFPARRILFA